MNPYRAMAIAGLLWGSFNAAAQTVVHVPPGDISELKQAIEAANSSGEATRLTLRGTFPFGPEDTLPAITGDIELIARFHGSAPLFKSAESGGPAQLLRIEEGGQLKIENLRFKRFALSAINRHEGPLIENHGELLIDGARFEDMAGFTGAGFCCSHERHEAIGNFGNLEVVRTTFLDVDIEHTIGMVIVNHEGTTQLREVLFASTEPSTGVVVANEAGTMRIINTTFGSGERAVYTGSGAVTEMGNTVIRRMNGQIPEEGFPEDWFLGESPEACAGPVVSLGHNLAADTSCNLNGPSDIQGVPTGTFPVSLESQRIGVLPIVDLAAASPAVDSANAALCGRVDLRGNARSADGDHDGILGCDRGAVELVQRRLTDGGINGFYFVPEEDGHYVTILDNDQNALVIWNTFDLEGNQAWIFGVGQIVNGRSLLATAYTNEDGVLTDVGPIDIERAVPWGTLLIELDSCNSGRLVFETDRPEFVSGQFPFQRLAAARQLGCR